jgi:hypothetical protein
MKMLTVLFAFVSFACQAQTTSSAPTMKGHTLGESVQEFVAASNDETRGQIKICSSTEKTVQASAPYECEAFNRTVKTGTGNFHCDLPMCQCTKLEFVETSEGMSHLPTTSWSC